jgi:hypothetical protein
VCAIAVAIARRIISGVAALLFMEKKALISPKHKKIEEAIY